LWARVGTFERYNSQRLALDVYPGAFTPLRNPPR